MRLLKSFLVLIVGVFSLCGCAKVDLLNALVPTSGYKVVKDIVYNDGDRGKLDVYVPDHLAKGHPVMVFSYGGSWKQGSKDDYLFVGQAFASRGIIAVIADYRLYPEVSFPEFMKDTAAAFVWTHKHIREYGGNPNNLFAAGHSAGAYNAVMLTLNRDYLKVAGGRTAWIKGVIGIAGPYDFLPLTDPTLIEIFGGRDRVTTQPITYVRHHVPPMLLVTGDEDEDVLPRNTYNLAEKLTSFGNQVTVKTYSGVAHIGIALALADGFHSKAPVLEDSVKFIESLTVPE